MAVEFIKKTVIVSSLLKKERETVNRGVRV